MTEAAALPRTPHRTRRSQVATVLFWITATPVWTIATLMGLFVTLASFDTPLMPEDLPWALTFFGEAAVIVAVPGLLASAVSGRLGWLYLGLLAGSGYFTLMSLLAWFQVTYAN